MYIYSHIATINEYYSNSQPDYTVIFPSHSRPLKKRYSIYTPLEILKFVNKQKIAKTDLGINMLDRVEDVAIIDSVKVYKKEFLSVYKLPRDLGKLDFYGEVNDVWIDLPQMAYYTGRDDKMLFAENVSDKQLDLNVSYRLLEGWSEATNLSSVLNTPEDENFPFELPDGVTLYFASKGHNSLGGYDIFMARYNSTINDYSEPINVGMPFNSPANDYLYVLMPLALKD